MQKGNSHLESSSAISKQSHQSANCSESVLVLKPALIGGFSFGPHQNDLSDLNTWFEDEWKGCQVSDFKHLAIVNSGLNEAGRHMND